MPAPRRHCFFSGRETEEISLRIFHIVLSVIIIRGHQADTNHYQSIERVVSSPDQLRNNINVAHQRCYTLIQVKISALHHCISVTYHCLYRTSTYAPVIIPSDHQIFIISQKNLPCESLHCIIVLYQRIASLSMSHIDVFIFYYFKSSNCSVPSDFKLRDRVTSYSSQDHPAVISTQSTYQLQLLSHC